MKTDEDAQRSTIQAVDRAFAIVETVLKMDGATPVELADRMDMPVSTIYDHLGTLVDLEYLLREDDDYRVSSKFLHIGNQMRAQQRVYQASRFELVKLARDTGHHGVLGVEEKGYVVNYDLAESDSSIRLLGGLGTRAHLHQAATGKALLAYKDPDAVRAYIDESGLPGPTQNTITEPDALFAELAGIREQRYALDREEAIEGTYGAAVPILDHTSTTVLGSIGVYAPADHEIESFMERIQSPLERAAHSVELDLAYRD